MTSSIIMRSSHIALILVAIVAVVAVVVEAVDRNKFRTCAQTSFCRHNRGTGGVDHDNLDRFQLMRTGLEVKEQSAEVVGFIRDTKWPTLAPLSFRLQVIRNDVVRFTVDEVSPLHPRWRVRDVLQDEALVAGPAGVALEEATNHVSMTFGDHNEYEWRVSVEPLPFEGELLIRGRSAMRVNSHGLMRFQAYRARNPAPPSPPPPPPSDDAGGEAAAAVAADTDSSSSSSSSMPYDADGDWEETFGGHTDKKRRGPSAVALDVEFVDSKHVFGIPEHASSLNLKTTVGEGGDYTDPYRLYNLDVFEYDLNVPMALYGAVPYLMSVNEHHSVGMFWLNAAETYIDVFDASSSPSPSSSSSSSSSHGGRAAHWISESGVIDVFVFTGPTPSRVLAQYGGLTGYTSLPQMFAIAYHQCRWNYKSEDDVAGVDRGFDEHDIPYDVIWLDIEHTDGKKYFTWDHAHFPTPALMQDKIAAKGRKMVTIVDPHIKRDGAYRVHTEAESKGLYVKKPADQGGDYEGWCWPGSVSYLDFLRTEVRDYWAGLFALDKYDGSTQNLYTWNDMNEPSVFNGPEVTMYKDNLHLAAEQVEHRDVHNVYGFYVQMATAQGHVQRDNARPFVLTRSFFAGSQKYGPMWTGDNLARWEHLEAAQPMLLTQGVAGYAFSGADVGGFFGDPDTELLTRWYQAGAFQPFFRAHGHIDTKRREPWLFGEPHTSRIREAIRGRYRLLPYLYTAFFEASRTGAPVMRPLWFNYPHEPATYGLEQEFMFGAHLLVKPVVHQGHTSVSVYAPGTDVWRETHTGTMYAAGSAHTIAAPMEYIPVLQRAGSIVPRKERARRASSLMVHDPYTLVIVLSSADGTAEGHLYVDDGRTFKYQAANGGEYSYRVFTMTGKVLTSRVVENGARPYKTNCVVERVVIHNYKSGVVSAATLKDADGNTTPVAVTTSSDDDTTVVLRKPNANIDQDWDIVLE